MTQHAILSASGAPRWTRCVGSLALSKGIVETSSKFADEGTAAHEVAQMCLEQGQDASAFAGRVITVGRGEGAQRTETRWEVTEEMVEAVQRYVDIVRNLGGELLIEQQVDFTRWLFDPGTGEEGEAAPKAFGTSDAIVILGDELVVCDLKYGKGVRVEAEDNEQLMLYALGSLDVADLIGAEIETVRLMIVQPRIPHVSEHVVTVAELEQFALRARIAARHAMHQYAGKAEPKLTPGEKQCRFCRAKGVCPALANEVKEMATGAAGVDDFEDLTLDATKAGLVSTDADLLSSMMAKVDLIEGFATALRAEVERRLVQGVEVPGFKLVAGKKGARAWVDATEAEATLKSMRLKQEQMYDFKLISPTTAEKLAKAGTLGARQWGKLQDYITQAQGKPSVAPVTDPRPAISVATTPEDFDDLSVADDLA